MLPLVLPTTLAALLRFSLPSTEVSLPRVAKLRQTVGFALTAARVHVGHLCQESWGSEPFAATLAWAAAGFSAGGFGFPFRQHLIVSSVAGQRRLTRLHAGGRLVLERYHAAFPGRFVQGLRFPPPEGRVVGKTIQATAREMLRGAISGETLFAAWK